MTLDYMSDRAANFKLINMVKEYWRKQGHNVRVWVEKASDPQGTGTIWVLRSSITQDVGNAKKGYVIG